MIENVLRTLGGIEHYGIISMVLFFASFLGMLAGAFLIKKPFLQQMSHMPLESDSEDSDNLTHDHE